MANAKNSTTTAATTATAQTGDAPRIRIRLKAYDHKVIDSAAKTIVDTALRSGSEVIGPVPLPVKRSTWTVVKSPHVYKKGGEAYEMRVHKRLIDIVNAKPKTIDMLQNLSLPAGVDAEIKM
jgi:small subunit ribosomal protein S10